MRRATLVAFGKEYMTHLRNDNATGLAAQLAYYFLLSLFPFLIFAVTLLAYTPVTVEDVIQLINQYAPGEATQLIRDNIKDALEDRSGGLLSFGIIATLWSASLALSSIINVLNRAYNVRENRSFLKSKAVAGILTLMLIFVTLRSH